MILGYKELEDPYKFVFDNQSGFILMYGDDDSSSPLLNKFYVRSTTGPIIWFIYKICRC